MNTAKILRRAAKLLETKGWTRGAYARTSSGRFCEPNCREAVRFCAIGAIERAGGGTVGPAYAALRRAIEGTVAHWNDTKGRTKRQVIAALLKAAENCDG